MTPKTKAASGDNASGFQIEPNDLDFATGAASDKAFASLAAQFALAGHALIRSTRPDGAAIYYAMRWGHIKPLPNLDAAQAFLLQIGGAR